MSNTISRILEKYRDKGPGPLSTALLLGGAAYGTSRLAWPTVVETLRSVGRPVGRGIYGGGSEGDAEWNEAMDKMRSNPVYRHWIPAAIGLVAAGGASVLFGGRGLGSWGTTPTARESSTYVKSPVDFKKAASSGILPGDGYITSLDWDKSLNLGLARDMFSPSVTGLENENYARHMGTAIVSDAALRQHTRRPTLGSIFDSAVDKLDKKLSFGGLANVAVRSAIANSAARLFTNALGSVSDLSPAVRQNIIDTGTWAGAITSILD